jgi:hypothetical protein
MALRIPVDSMDFSSDQIKHFTSFSSSPKNFRSAVSVGCLVDFLLLGRNQFLVLQIGPTYPLRIPEHGFFIFVVILAKVMKYW